MVICLERGADLHMAQLMPLPLTVSCFGEIQIGFTFLVPAHLDSPGKGPLNGCVYVLTKLLRCLSSTCHLCACARLHDVWCGSDSRPVQPVLWHLCWYCWLWSGTRRCPGPGAVCPNSHRGDLWQCYRTVWCHRFHSAGQ